MEPLEVLQLVVSKLDELSVPYMLGGSFASSLYGLARTTQDADFVVYLRADQVERFVEIFRCEFYVDRGSIERALGAESSFNVVHLESAFKADFFMLRGRSFDQTSFSRRQPRPIDPDSRLEAYFQTAEDTLLSKLDWFRQGGGVSETQWRDALGILKAQAGRLDMSYVRHWAEELGLLGLLNQATLEANMLSK